MTVDDTTQTDVRSDALAETGRLKRNIALTLACLLVLGGGLAILQVDASIRESNTARETTRVAVRAMRANVVAATVAGLEPQLQAERDFLRFRRPFRTTGANLADATALSRQSAVELPELGVDPLRERLALDAERLALKQRAMATTRVTWNDRSTQYTTVIAVLAVALFLVGFGLVVEGPIRRSAYALGAGVGLFAAGWAAWIYHLPIPSTPAPAIEATARGIMLTEAARYTPAIAAFDLALRADATYAPAYVGRSRARLLAANPDYPTTRAVTDASGRTVDAAVEDSRRALELDDRVLVAHALLALTSFYAGNYDDSVAAVDDAIELNAKSPRPMASSERRAARAQRGRARDRLAQASARTPSRHRPVSTDAAPRLHIPELPGLDRPSRTGRFA